MTSIDPTGRLLASLREQAQALRRQSPTSPARPKDASATRTTGKSEDWSARLARNIAAIDKDDPQRDRKAFRAYLESVLLQELGASLAADPAFGALLDRVQDTMEGDPALKLSMERASAVLLAKVKPAS